jgi:DNA polymerase-1
MVEVKTDQEAVIFPQRGVNLKSHLSELRNAKIVGLDTETTGLDPFIHEIRLIQLAVEDYPVLVVDLWNLDVEERKALQSFLASPTIKVLHNCCSSLAQAQPTPPLF